jgi:hypothetical protein
MDIGHPVESSLHARGLSAAEVALHAMGPHDFAAGGDLKPPLGSLVCFQLLLRHDADHPLSRADSASVEADSRS